AGAVANAFILHAQRVGLMVEVDLKSAAFAAHLATVAPDLPADPDRAGSQAVILVDGDLSVVDPQRHFGDTVELARADGFVGHFEFSSFQQHAEILLLDCPRLSTRDSL